MIRLSTLAAGVVIAALGFFCLNFTNGFGIDHHTAWANAHGMPPPSPLIFDAGVSLLALGAGIVGYAIRCKKREQRQRLEEDFAALVVERDRLADELERRGAARIERDARGAIRQVVVVRPSDSTEPESQDGSSREHGRDQGRQGR